VFNPLDDNIYLANEGSNTISVINSKTKAQNNIELSSRPNGMALDSSAGNIYVASESSPTVYAINSQTSTIINTIRLSDR
jgi:YVTN family beta-propeller protein